MATNGDQIVTIGGRPLYPIIDDDDMSEATAYNIPSAGSVKAYVDTKTGALSVEETARVNSLIDYLSDGLLISSDLAISGTAAKFKTTATAAYTIGGLCYTKAATDDLTFTAADTINTAAGAGDFFGVWLVQINATGTVSTKSPAADQVYASEASAIAALPDADTGNIAIGYIAIGAKTGASWTANADDMTPGGDCASASFVDATLKTLPAKLA